MYFIIVERLTIAILRCFIFGQISMCLENLRILWTFNTLWRGCWHSDLKMNWTRNNCNNHNNRCLLCCAFITFTKNRFNSTRKENRNFHHVLQNCCKKRWLMYCQIQLSKFAFIHDCKPRTLVISARFWAKSCPNLLFRFLGSGRYANTPKRCPIAKSRWKIATFEYFRFSLYKYWR